MTHIESPDIIFPGLQDEVAAGLYARLPQVRFSLLEGHDVDEARVHDCNGEVWLRFDLVGYGKTIRAIVQKEDATMAGRIDGLAIVEEAYMGTEAPSLAEAQAEKGIVERLEAFVGTMNAGIEIIDATILRPHGADIDNMAGDAFYVRVRRLNGETPEKTLQRGATIALPMLEKIESEMGVKARCGMRYVGAGEIAFTAGIDHFVFAVGQHWQKLYAIESAASPGKVWIDPASADHFANWDALKPVDNKGNSYFEVNADVFKPSEPVSLTPLTVHSEETPRVIELIRAHSRELPTSSEHRPVFVTFTTIKGSLGETKDGMLRTIAHIASALKTVEQKSGLFFWKIDSSPNGDIVVIGMHEGLQGNQGASPAEGILMGHLFLQEALEVIDLTVDTAIHRGRMLLKPVGSQRRIIIDGMGDVINDAARHAQFSGIVVSQAAEAEFTAQNLEVGKPVLLHGAKELPDKQPASLVRSRADVRAIDPFVETKMGLLLEFEEKIKEWAKENSIERFDWQRIMESVAHHVTGGDVIFANVAGEHESPFNNRALLQEVAVRLRADLRAGKSTREIEQEIAKVTADSQEVQRVVDDLKGRHGEVLNLIAVLLAGKNALISEAKIREIGTSIGIPIEDCLDYLLFHRFILVENGQMRLFAPFHRRIYESLSNELRQSQHAAIARYYSDFIEKHSQHITAEYVIQLVKDFVFHGYESHDPQLLIDVCKKMPLVINHFRAHNDWASMRQHAEWFLHICPASEKVYGLLWRGEALIQLGEFVDAHACYRKIICMPRSLMPQDFPFWLAETEEAFTRTFIELHNPDEDPVKARAVRQQGIIWVLQDLEHIFELVSGDRQKGIPPNHHAQVKVLRRMGEIYARTAGLDKRKFSIYTNYAEFLYKAGYILTDLESWGTIAPIWGRLGRDIGPIQYAISRLEKTYCPAYAEPLTALYLARGTYEMIHEKQDAAEMSIRSGLEYAKKSQNKLKMLEAMNNLADLLIKANRLEGVDELVEEALELADRVQHWYMKGATHELKGLLYMRRYLNMRGSNEQEAQQYLIQALTHLPIAVDHFLYIHSYGDEGIGMVRDDVKEIFGDQAILAEVKEFIDELPTLEVLPA